MLLLFSYYIAGSVCSS